MTWGEQNTEQEAPAQIDYALDHGVNLIDTAEIMVPPRAQETRGSTERFIGDLAARSTRSAREEDRAGHQDRRTRASAAQSASHPR